MSILQVICMDLSVKSILSWGLNIHKHNIQVVGKVIQLFCYIMYEM